MKLALRGGLAVTLSLLCPILASAQSKSAPLAKELAAALDAAKLETLAAADPANPGVYVGVLYVPGGQLLTVASKFPAPASIDYKLRTKAYRDVYMDLSADRAGAGKFFVEDMGADGVQAKRRGDDPFDSVEMDGKRVALDSEPKKQKLSSEDYQRVYESADQRYAQLLTALLEQLKKGL